MTTGRSEDYSTWCLLDYDYYTKDFNIAVLDSDPEINQQTEFVYKFPSGNNVIDYNLLTVLEKGKQTVLEFNEGPVKVY